MYFVTRNTLLGIIALCGDLFYMPEALMYE